MVVETDEPPGLVKAPVMKERLGVEGLLERREGGYREGAPGGWTMHWADRP